MIWQLIGFALSVPTAGPSHRYRHRLPHHYNDYSPRYHYAYYYAAEESEIKEEKLRVDITDIAATYVLDKNTQEIKKCLHEPYKEQQPVCETTTLKSLPNEDGLRNDEFLAQDISFIPKRIEVTPPEPVDNLILLSEFDRPTSAENTLTFIFDCKKQTAVVAKQIQGGKIVWKAYNSCGSSESRVIELAKGVSSEGAEQEAEE